MIKRSIPNLFTAGNMICGVVAIILTLDGKIEYAPIFIIIAAVLDFLDGFVARALKVDGPLGKQLDSLADMVTFGVAPGIIMFELIKAKVQSAHFLHGFYPVEIEYSYQWSKIAMENLKFYQDVQLYNMPGLSKFLPLAAFAIPFFALFRLAQFNIDERQTNSFIGVPTPAATLFVVGISLILANSYNNTVFGSWPTYFLWNSYLLVLLSLLIGVLMVVPVELFSLKFKTFGWKGNEVKYIFITISVLMLATLFCWGLPLVIVFYVMLSMMKNVGIRRQEARGKL
ncbi:MAG: CDP-alcohol phosphatidyltransferase family protein [Crocinitomicaceae bacterium]|nr:CDP-alcohol phosphatidyltransferase family protein [Crocinitomicaceae bacterium]